MKISRPKKKRLPKKGNQKKVASHRAFVNKVSKGMSKDFLVNRLIGEFVSTTDVDPFNFVVTIKRIPNLTITGININGVQSKKGDFETTDQEITCKMEAISSTNTFLLIINALGDSFSKSTFNLTCDTKKAFSKDEEIKINSNGRGAYSNPRVPLP